MAGSDEWVGAPGAADMLGIGLRTLYRRIDAGELPAYRFGRVIRLRRRDIDIFVEHARMRPQRHAADAVREDIW